MMYQYLLVLYIIFNLCDILFHFSFFFSSFLPPFPSLVPPSPLASLFHLHIGELYPPICLQCSHSPSQLLPLNRRTISHSRLELPSTPPLRQGAKPILFSSSSPSTFCLLAIFLSTFVGLVLSLLSMGAGCFLASL